MDLDEELNDVVRLTIHASGSRIVPIRRIVEALGAQFPEVSADEISLRIIAVVKALGGAVMWDGEGKPTRCP